LTASRIVARIEDFEPGQHASFRKTFTDEDIRRFIEITGDTNPLHVDDEFAAKTRFGRRIVHGMLSASLFSTIVGTLLPGTGAIYRSQTIRFLRPVHPGDTVTAHLVVRSVDRSRHRLEIDAWIENEAGERVIEGACEVGLLRAAP
jgi:3-hydroxybutyryl-CoA dehydratase